MTSVFWRRSRFQALPIRQGHLGLQRWFGRFTVLESLLFWPELCFLCVFVDAVTVLLVFCVELLKKGTLAFVAWGLSKNYVEKSLKIFVKFSKICRSPCFYEKIGYNGENTIFKEITYEIEKWLLGQVPS